ncbi:hypothetical protein G3I15_54835, partial [Streptomyces sp. SID10244]|nr:hypothetical protein [Streptomyces sp. SID10244]
SIDDALGEIDAADVAERILAVLRALPDAADTDVDHLDVLLPAERAALEQTDHDAPADLPATVVEAIARQ